MLETEKNSIMSSTGILCDIFMFAFPYSADKHPENFWAGHHIQTSIFQVWR